MNNDLLTNTPYATANGSFDLAAYPTTLWTHFVDDIPQLIEIAFAGLVFALALSFGLGGRDHARDWIGQMRQRA